MGAELRKLREHAGLATREAAELLSVNAARISSIEAGRFGVSAERVQMFARNYGCTDEPYVTALADMTAGHHGQARNWWDDYRGVLPSGMFDLAEVEHHALAIRTAQVSLLPGLLQTAEYATLVFRQSAPGLSPSELGHRVEHRMKRQEILRGEDPTPYTAVIHEAALRMRFGGRRAMRAQLRHIAEMSESEGVAVRVVPFEAGAFPGSGQTMLYATGPVPQLDTVQLDAEHGSVFVHAGPQLEKYRTFAQRFEAVALPEKESRDLVGVIAGGL